MQNKIENGESEKILFSLEPPTLLVGKYTLSNVVVRVGDKSPFFYRNDIYIRHESGEGMSTPIESIEALIDRFYGKNF